MAVMESDPDWHIARAQLEWQVEMGVDEAISDTPIDRFALESAARAAVPAVAPDRACARAVRGGTVTG